MWDVFHFIQRRGIPGVGVTGKWQKQSSLLKKETNFPSCHVTYIEKQINRNIALL